MATKVRWAILTSLIFLMVLTNTAGRSSWESDSQELSTEDDDSVERASSESNESDEESEEAPVKKKPGGLFTKTITPLVQLLGGVLQVPLGAKSSSNSQTPSDKLNVTQANKGTPLTLQSPPKQIKDVTATSMGALPRAASL